MSESGSKSVGHSADGVDGKKEEKKRRRKEREKSFATIMVDR